MNKIKTLERINVTLSNITANPPIDEILAIVSIPWLTSQVIAITPMIEINETVKVEFNPNRCHVFVVSWPKIMVEIVIQIF